MHMSTRHPRALPAAGRRSGTRPVRRYAALIATLALAVPAAITACTPPAVGATSDPAVCFASDVQAGTGGSQARFAAYLKSLSCTRVVMPGDLTDGGTVSQWKLFAGWYGSIKSKILPARGNHDARSPLSNYVGYWGSRVTTGGKPWYSVNLGAWHLVSLEVTTGPATAAEVAWLTKDLDANRGKPTLAFWHVPRYSTGRYGDTSWSESLWKVLAAHGADVVVNGHAHVAQRFVVTRGIREWIDSSAGANLRTSTNKSSLARAWIVPGPQFGVLRLVLHAKSYDWRFTSLFGTQLNAGSSAVT